ncbi:MAG: proline dehydrogenase family protein [Methanomassiliicoccales archaeon]|nr:proline dehydrogenase family protein [Methanomassiliicoccales archaeon]
MDEYENRWALPDWHSTLLWCKARNSQAIRTIIDILGEDADEKEAVIAESSYHEVLRSITDEKLCAGISVKVTQLGYPHDKDGCMERSLSIAKDAAARRISFEIDMEGRGMVDFALEAVAACASENYPVTVALQAYLDRTVEDLARVVEHGAEVRAVKGAYSGDVADFQEIQMRFKALVERLLETGSAFCIGTHDPELIEWATEAASETSDRIEFSLLKGLSDQTKLEFVKHGWKVSEYVPFGKDKAAYEDRRRMYLRHLEEMGRQPAP